MIRSKMLATSATLTAIFATTLVASAAQAEIKCTAIYEYLNSRNKLEHQEVELQKVHEEPGMIVLEADLNNRNFSLRGNPTGNEFLLFITEGPDYLAGIVTNATFNSSGHLRVSSVEGPVVHKLSCSR